MVYIGSFPSEADISSLDHRHIQTIFQNEAFSLLGSGLTRVG